MNQLELIKTSYTNLYFTNIHHSYASFLASKNVATQSEISIGDHYTAFSSLRTYHVA